MTGKGRIQKEQATGEVYDKVAVQLGQ